ncbi:hypothetical protein TrVFT333_002904 [Trichoderma virens FT-333]|nr:hypothetical protein TrVFT333_002904 [Trichoderma virens FT-333]
MVLLEHLPLLGLALGLAHHHNHGRSSHHHPSLPNHKPVHQISADVSHFHQSPKLIASRASDEIQETAIEVSKDQLGTILDKLQALEQEIYNILANADSSLELGSTPARQASRNSAPLAPTNPEKLVVTTRESKPAPATIIGGLFKESSVDMDASAVSDDKFTTIVTSTTRITRTVTIVPPGIVTVTAFPSNPAEESKFKAMIPFANGTTSAARPRTTLSGDRVQPLNLSSTNLDAEQGRPMITPVGFNASASIRHLSLSATASGFRTLRRAA